MEDNLLNTVAITIQYAQLHIFTTSFSNTGSRIVRTAQAIVTSSKDDNDNSENDGKKMNLRSFKLNRVYLDPLNMSNAGDFSWS